MLFRRLLIILLPLTAAAIAGEFPSTVRIASTPNHFAAAIQLTPGTDGNFELFTGQPTRQPIHPLGRYNGRLAGVAVDPDGKILALTSDGSLTAHADDLQPLALPDTRWQMQALAIQANSPVAATLDGNNLHLARPDHNQNWIQDPTPIAHTEYPMRTELVPLNDTLHLFWITRTDQLSGGVIRHAVQHENTWEEKPPLTLGNTVGFCAFPDGDSILLSALTADPLAAGPEHAIFKRWKNNAWTDADVPTEMRHSLENRPFSFAAAAIPQKETLLLISNADGAILNRFTPAGAASKSTLTPAPEKAEVGLAPRFTSLISVGMILLLLLLYCRRSRVISKNHPEKAPDLLSRGAALGIDWMLASLAMGAYHWAAGDVRILPDMLRLGQVEGIFWANLAGLALFMFMAEAAFGATPGKYLAGLRVVSVFGGKPGVLQTAMRNFLRAIDMYPFSGTFPGIIGAVSTFLNRNRQRIGDMMAGTLVKRHLPLDKRGFLLASASPRRLELLNELGVKVRVEAPNINEDSIKEATPEDTVRTLAQEKAKAMLEKARPPELVVAADTIVVLDGEIMGKPADPADATAMLKKLSGRSHSVFTGVTVWDPASGRGLTDVEETEVEFRELSDTEIAAYVATGDPLDKAGAYGIQTGYLVKQVRGSLSNVAGLPMEKLQTMVEHLGI